MDLCIVGYILFSMCETRQKLQKLKKKIINTNWTPAYQVCMIFQVNNLSIFLAA